MGCVCAAEAQLLFTTLLIKPKPCRPNNHHPPITTFSTPPLLSSSVTYSHRSSSSSSRIYTNNYIPPPSDSVSVVNNNNNSNYYYYSSSVVSDDRGARPCTTTLRDLCKGHVPDFILTRMEEVGFVMPTDVQKEALPVLLSGCDCILHAQTGSGKTLAYLLAIYSVINSGKSVQALIVVPTRELGMQVTKVARLLTGSVMTLLDGGSLTRQKSWLKAEPPTIVVATLCSLCRMLEKRSLKLESLKVLVVDEVDALFNSPKEVSSLRKLLTSYSSKNNRQTIFASASIPQHKRFFNNCIQEKWTKDNIVHVHVNAVQPIPTRLHHRFVVCSKDERLQILRTLLDSDTPQSAIIFASELVTTLISPYFGTLSFVPVVAKILSEKSKMLGETPPTTLLIEYLKTLNTSCFDILLLEEDMNINSRAASLSEMRRGGRFLLVATDMASRGVDLPETTHVYNFDLPRCAVDYLHRAGRTGRRPFSDKKCHVSSIITAKERFVLQRYENELKFCCEEMFV